MTNIKYLISMIILLLLLCSTIYLIGFVKGYTSNNTKHEFIIDVSQNMKDMASMMENITAMQSKGNKTCLQGCYYLWYKGIPDENTIMYGGIRKEDCNIYCG